jgi:hypothetical protein
VTHRSYDWGSHRWNSVPSSLTSCSPVNAATSYVNVICRSRIGNRLRRSPRCDVVGKANDRRAFVDPRIKRIL